MLELMAILWHEDSAILLGFLGTNHAALPRGRFEAVRSVADGRPVATWRVMHNDDEPVVSSRTMILRSFNLTDAAGAGQVEFAADPEVRLIPADCRRLQAALRTELGVRGVNHAPHT